MYASRSVPLVRASLFEPFLEAARQIGAPIEKLMYAAGLPAEFLDSADDPARLLPEIPCWRFAESVSRLEGLADFGLLAGRNTAYQDISTLAPFIAGCVNLHDLLRRIVALAPLHAYSGRYVVEEKGDLVSFEQRGNRLLSGDVQIQLFEVLGMTQFVRLAAGPDWHPSEAHFTFGRRNWLASTAEFAASRLQFGSRHPAIVFPRHLLALPLSGHQISAKPVDANPPALKVLPTSFDTSLRDALLPYIGTRLINKDLVAELTGLSPRTVQRRLARQGTSYIRVLEQARLMKAVSLLLDTDLKLLEISFMLGYQNAPAFSRAFRRWTGVSPREYRQLFAHRNAVRRAVAAG